MDKNKPLEEDEDELPLVLVVDDDEICQQFIIKQLHEEKLDVKTHTAVNVNEAVSLIQEQIKKEQNFDIIFLDMYLKDNQHGIELLKIISDNGWLKEALIIVMSGTEDPNIIEKCYDYKIQNFLKKPITKVNFKNEIIKVRKKYLEQLVCPVKDYKYLRFLGEGTNRKVILVREKRTKMKYALKSIKYQNNEMGISKELEEMQFLRGILSPTVIKLKEFSNEDSNLFLILEYAEGGTLNDVIKNNANKKEFLPDDVIISWITEICLGLFHIHEMGLLHRDIKSENLFLCKNVVKIGDLGAARALGEGARAATMVGTTYYMSPEIMLNKEYGNKVDIWSVGVVFYELLTNSLPFKGYDAEEIKKKVTSCDYNIDLIPKDRNPELISLLKKMLVLKPEDRFSAVECLQFRIINQRLHSLIGDDVLKMDEEANLKIMKITPLLESKKVNISDKDREKMFEYYADLEKAKKIDCSAIKQVYKPGFFKSKIYNTITGSNLEITISDLRLKPKDVEVLLEKKYIINCSNNGSLEFDASEQVYYKVITDESISFDNSIIYPFEQTIEDPVSLSINCLMKIEKLLTTLNEIGENEGESQDENELKIKLSASKPYLEFLIEIRKLRQIKVSSLSKEQKLTAMLNLYITMFKHYQIKNFLVGNEKDPTMLENIKSMFVSNNKLDVAYDIGGQKISLYEMKHIVIRRNKKPYDNYYFNVASSSDPRVNFINESNHTIMEKLLLICIDPIDNIDDYNLNFGYFEANKIYEQIDARCNSFYQDNVKIDNSQILIPKFLSTYSKDFGSKPVDIIKFLLKFNTDSDVKLNNVMRSFNENKLQINWY